MKIFKSFLLVLFAINIQAQDDNRVLMTVGDSEVTVSEFKYIYEKNNGKTADYSEASLQEYLDLYTKFKLKVNRAKDMKLDTIETLKEELSGYRNQLATSFLTDKGVEDRLIEEIYNRKKKDILVRHIQINAAERGPDSDKRRAREKLLKIKDELRQGRSFDKLAKQYSEDKNTKSNGGLLGYVTSNLPSGFYAFENAVYDLQIGEVSEPVQSKLGYHLIKVEDIRPARGMIEVAHIFRKIEKDKGETFDSESEFINGLLTQLNSGADFEDLAEKHSDDKTTKTKGGRLPKFGIGMYDVVFEDAAFSLEKDREISGVLQTSSGLHIIKRLRKIPEETISDIDGRMRARLKKYDRYNIAKAELIERIKNESSYSENNKIWEDLVAELDESFYSYKWKPSGNNENEILFTFGEDDHALVKDFTYFARKQTRLRSQFNKSKPIPEGARVVYDEFVKTKAYEYEQKNLEEKYPEFRSLMREYSEGILLFEATKINVWDRANQDSVGLQSFYEMNKANYQFDKQATIGTYILNTDDEKKIKKIMKCAKKHNPEKTLSRFNKDGKEMIEYSEMKVEAGSEMLKGLELKEKSISEPVVDKQNKKSTFRKVAKVDPPRMKTLKEARGYVVADYQDSLEENWINELKADYKVTLDQKVLESLVK